MMMELGGREMKVKRKGFMGVVWLRGKGLV